MQKDHPSGTALMLGKGIASGKNKDFVNDGKKFLNKKNFLMEIKLISTQLEKARL